MSSKVRVIFTKEGQRSLSSAINRHFTIRDRYPPFFVLRHVFGLTHREIAHFTDIPLRTVQGYSRGNMPNKRHRLSLLNLLGQAYLKSAVLMPPEFKNWVTASRETASAIIQREEANATLQQTRQSIPRLLYQLLRNEPKPRAECIDFLTSRGKEYRSILAAARRLGVVTEYRRVDGEEIPHWRV